MKYNYKVVRSARKTLSVSISVDNSITVRAPYGLTDERINYFIQSKSRWIDKKLSANEANVSAFSDIVDYSHALVGGEKFPLVTGGGMTFADGAVRVNGLNDLKKIYVQYFGDEFINRFYMISKAAGLNAASVRFRSYKSRWGCCDGNKNITFNYKVLMLPPDMQNYIIIHELCHTRQMNHSAKFWKDVNKLFPRYKEVKASLKSYSFITRLYP